LPNKLWSEEKINFKFTRKGVKIRMKKILFLAIAVIFVLGISGLGFAADELYQGTVMKISGHKITVKSDEGKIVTLIGNAQDLKAGDKVTVNNGRVIKEGVPGPPPQAYPANSKSK
jgi:hypothetical protein